MKHVFLSGEFQEFAYLVKLYHSYHNLSLTFSQKIKAKIKNGSRDIQAKHSDGTSSAAHSRR